MANLNVYVTEALNERLKPYRMGKGRKGGRLHISRVVERALLAELERLERPLPDWLGEQ